MALNRCEFIGNVGKIETRALNNGNKVVNLSIAVTDKWKAKDTGEQKEATTWIDIVVFSKGLVHVFEQYVNIGSKIYVAGRWANRSWEKDGNKHYKTELVLDGFDSKLELLGGKSDTAPQQQQTQSATPDFDSDAPPF